MLLQKELMTGGLVNMHLLAERLMNTSSGYIIDNLTLEHENCALIITGDCRGSILYYDEGFMIGVQFDQKNTLPLDYVELFNILTEFTGMEKHGKVKEMALLVERAIMGEIVRLLNNV